MQSGATRSHRREQKAREVVARTNLDRPQVHPRRDALLVDFGWRRRWRGHGAGGTRSDLSRRRTRARRVGEVWKLGIKEKTCLVLLQLHPEIFWCGLVVTN